MNVWPLIVKAKCGEATLRCAVGTGYVTVQDVAAIMIPEAPRQIILQDKVAGGPPTLRVVSPTSVRLRPEVSTDIATPSTLVNTASSMLETFARVAIVAIGIPGKMGGADVLTGSSLTPGMIPLPEVAPESGVFFCETWELAGGAFEPTAPA